MANHNSAEDVVVVIAPLPAQGHINQLLHLARLIIGFGIPVHVIGTATHNRQGKTRIHGWDPNSDPNIHFHDFEIPQFKNPRPDPESGHNFPSHLLPAFRATRHLRAPVSALLWSIAGSTRNLVVIHDSLMGSVVQDAAAIPNAESFTFHSVSAFAVFLFYWDRMAKADPKLAAVRAIPNRVPTLDGCMTSDMLEFVASNYEYNKLNLGNLYNTSRVIERPYMDALTQILPNKKHWAIGPFNPVDPANFRVPSRDPHPCLGWLNRQAENSVVYVSFGTTTALSAEQVAQLALGLEQSGSKFIWVFRDADTGDVFDPSGAREIGLGLPKGFESKVRNQGILVLDWAPQTEILGHPATGGFLSHCGWNSCMESFTMGVPLGAWPMHSDQPRNTVLVTEVLGVGTVVRDWSRRREVALAAEVAAGVRRLMMSEEMRCRAAKLRENLRRSVAADGGGVSRKELESFIAHIRR